MPLRLSASASFFCCSSAVVRLCSCASDGLIVVPHGLHDLGDLALDLVLGRLNGERELHHVRVTRAELLRQLRLLPLQVGELGLLLLDEAIRQNRRERCRGRRGRSAGCGSGCRPLPSGCARSWPSSPRAFRSASFWTTMFCRSSRDTESVCSRYRCSACSLVSTCFRCSASAPPEPVGGLLRRQELEFEVLLDVLLGQAFATVAARGGIGTTGTSHRPAGCCGRARPSGAARSDRSSGLRLRFVRRRGLASRDGVVNHPRHDLRAAPTRLTTRRGVGAD